MAFTDLLRLVRSCRGKGLRNVIWEHHAEQVASVRARSKKVDFVQPENANQKSTLKNLECQSLPFFHSLAQFMRKQPPASTKHFHWLPERWALRERRGATECWSYKSRPSTIPNSKTVPTSNEATASTQVALNVFHHTGIQVRNEPHDATKIRSTYNGNA